MAGMIIDGISICEGEGQMPVTRDELATFMNEARKARMVIGEICKLMKDDLPDGQAAAMAASGLATAAIVLSQWETMGDRLMANLPANDA